MKIYTDQQLKGLKSPPLIDGEFCIHTYKAWKTVNKLWPWDMKFDQWRELEQSTKEKHGYDVYLAQLKHWFDSVKLRIESGEHVDTFIVDDYNNRTQQ